MKRIVSWAAIIMLAFSTYLNVFLSLDKMEDPTASAAGANPADSSDKTGAGDKSGKFSAENNIRVSFKTPDVSR